jgi:hypothetical protein
MPGKNPPCPILSVFLTKGWEITAPDPKEFFADYFLDSYTMENHGQSRPVRELASIRATRIRAIARNCLSGGKFMQTATEKLLPAQKEVHRTAHDQDLVEVPRRAWLDREAEGKKLPHVVPVREKL